MLDRLVALDGAVANGRAFCALLQTLHGQNLGAATEPHISAITMVRAGILRAAISTVMACLDPADRRGNCASVGQILQMLEDDSVVAVFPGAGAESEMGRAALAKAKADYDVLAAGDLFDRGKQLRNNAIAHVLIPDKPTPEVAYETIYQLQDAAERLVTALYQACHRGTPQFVGHQASLEHHAHIFWQTYFEAIS